MALTRSRPTHTPRLSLDADDIARIRYVLQGELRALAIPPEMVITLWDAGLEPAHGGRLGDYLCAHQLITEDDLACALAEQQRRIAQGRPIALGDLLVEQGRITAHELVTVLMLQHLDRQESLALEAPSPLGQLLVRAGLITADQLHAALTIQTAARQQGDAIRLGQVLLVMGVLSRHDLATTLVHQRRTRRR
jgi:hypothetical protein